MSEFEDHIGTNRLGKHELLSREEEQSLARTIDRSRGAAVLNEMYQENLNSWRAIAVNTVENFRANPQAVQKAKQYKDRAIESFVDFINDCHLLELTDEQVLDLVTRLVEEGKDAVHVLGESNTRLVLSIATKYQGQGMDYEDLVGEGMIGLMKGAWRFDYRKGTRFSTHASYWIHQNISRTIKEKGRAVRPPLYITDIVRHMYKNAESFAQEYGREPTLPELLEAMQQNEECISFFAIHNCSLTLETLTYITNREYQTNNPESLQKDVYEDGNEMFQDRVPDPDEVPVEEQVSQNLQVEHAFKYIHTLSMRDQAIVILRLGLEGQRPRTFDEIGDNVGITKQGAEQRYKVILNMLRKKVHLDRALRPPRRMEEDL